MQLIFASAPLDQVNLDVEAPCLGKVIECQQQGSLEQIGGLGPQDPVTGAIHDFAAQLLT